MQSISISIILVLIFPMVICQNPDAATTIFAQAFNLPILIPNAQGLAIQPGPSKADSSVSVNKNINS